MNLIDTHTHLYWDSFQKDFDEVIKRALDAGVSIIINVGVDVEKSKEALRQVQEIKWPSGMTVYSTIGIHPHEAYRYIDNPAALQKDINALEQIYLSDKDAVIAVGECGLDYKEVDEQIKQLQRQLFQAQIDLAKKLNLPLIVHCRDDRSKNPQNCDAWDETLEIVKDHFGILHCYSGLPQTTRKALTTRFLISFAGNLTYPKNEYLMKAVKEIPTERIVLETDCPFLPPQSRRGQRNEPANILEIAQMLAEDKNLTIEQIADRTSNNIIKLFALSG